MEETKLCYDDVLLKPKKTGVESLSNVDTSTELAGITLEAPMISAPMDTVTERRMAEEIAEQGGIGVVHRFLEPSEQAEMVEGISPVAGAVGLNEYSRCKELVDAGVDMLVADIAHGHHEAFMDYIEDITEAYDVPVAAGNVATVEGAYDLSKSGADIVKIGVGPGAACTTREMTGAGYPQFSAVKEISEQNLDADLIADGGIRKPGDLCKALMAGADAVMCGGVFGDTYESPKDGEFRGMSTKAAAEDRSDRDLKESDSYEEGEVMFYEENNCVEDVIQEYLGGLRSGLSYCGANNVTDARDKSEFVRVTGSTQYRNGAHGN
ncbi:MAG: guanosine monophosphate reductase [Nanohaloarchaea archaeon SW_7_43_1]|nr:MAG: guanosine monophosphate reductase [Nanohaloarchaea archaeon SW_7_43_1]